mmetsp:Transcript_10055/g.35082  ORF Transcript_10055/g.35082 Transcript_10055/m.35082 type:complete len:123 (+) Transcript_10055:412-780(+)
MGCHLAMYRHRLLGSPLAASWLSAEKSRVRRLLSSASVALLCLTAVVSTFLVLLQMGREPLDSLKHAKAGCRSEHGPIGFAFECASKTLGVLAGATAVAAAAPNVDARGCFCLLPVSHPGLR